MKRLNKEVKPQRFKFFLPYLKPYKKNLILGPMAKMVEAVFELLTPLLMAYVVDQAILGEKELNFFWHYGLILLLMVIFSVLFAFLCQYLAAEASQGVGTLLRNSVFRKVQSLSYAQLDNLGSTSLTNRLGPDIIQIQHAVAMFIRLLFRAPFLAIGGSIMAFAIHPKIAGLLVVSIIIAAIILALIVKFSMPEMRRAQSGIDKLGRVVTDHFSGVRIIRAFNRSEHERRYFAKSNQEVNHHLERAAKISAFMNPGTVIVVNIAIVLALYMGLQDVESGVILPGQMIALINYFTQVLLAMTVTANLVLAVPRILSASERLVEVLGTEEDMALIEDDTDYSEDLMSLQNVHFAYSAEGQDVLKGVNISIAPGNFIGIIGSTGSGKSTVANIMQRFYEPQEGRVYFMGKDLRTLSRAEIQQNISYVPQVINLFTGTIRSNLTMGIEGVTDDAIWYALQQAEAKDFVAALDLGLDAKLERSGRNFSGGQRQRLTLARALIREAKLLIIDDSMSALDYKTEREVLKNLRSLDAGQSIVMISQRIHTIKHCDKIYVLEAGEIVGCGTHDDLILENQVYQEIEASQISPEEVL